jgi:hypothetical protein
MKTTKSPSTPSGSGPKTQIDKFKEAARELETDDREEAFDQALKRVGRPTRDPKVAGKAVKKGASR